VCLEEGVVTEVVMKMAFLFITEFKLILTIELSRVSNDSGDLEKCTFSWLIMFLLQLSFRSFISGAMNALVIELNINF
jgi:hypothetical protein